MTTSPTPSKLKKRPMKTLVIGSIIVVILLVILVPVALAGGFTVPVASATFSETTGSLVAGNLNVTTQTVNVFEYYFSIRTGGMIRTTNQGSMSSSDTTNITLTMKLTNPSNQTIDLGNSNVNGGIGTRSHTIYLSVDQGVRAPGSYKLDIVITASVKVGGLLQTNLSASLVATFTIS